MKPWMLRILLCLSLGTMTTVGVAWSLKLRGFTAYGNFQNIQDTDEDPWYVYSVSDFGRMFLSAETNELAAKQSITDERIPGWSQFRELPGSPENKVELHVEYAYGWPLLAIGYTFNGYYYRDSTSQSEEFSGLITQWNLPIIPIWSGMLINTFVYASLWSVLYINIITLRRELQSRRGRCLICNYDLRHDLLAGCPECGWNREEEH